MCQIKDNRSGVVFDMHTLANVLPPYIVHCARTTAMNSYVECIGRGSKGFLAESDLQPDLFQ